jgi:hypothetical protein
MSECVSYVWQYLKDHDASNWFVIIVSRIRLASYSFDFIFLVGQPEKAKYPSFSRYLYPLKFKHWPDSA